ncbi:MAG: hypothetical protein OEW50_12465, partial [Gammaproteobacteria bacterium]|nr:hypothetical protein [Gammaproteobacteria bacterium]
MAGIAGRDPRNEGRSARKGLQVGLPFYFGAPSTRCAWVERLIAGRHAIRPYCDPAFRPRNIKMKRLLTALLFSSAIAFPALAALKQGDQA